MGHHIGRGLVALLGLFLAGTAPAQNFTVTNTNDGGAGSLRDAIDQANALGAGAKTVNITATGTIILTSGQLRISSGPLAITGPGAGSLTIDGSANGRIFAVVEAAAPACPALTGPSDYLVSISGMTLQNGLVDPTRSGGAIFSAKSLALESMVIRTSVAKYGGGVSWLTQHPGQSLTANNVQFLDNVARPLGSVSGEVQGGALFISEYCSGTETAASATITGSLFAGNRVQPAPLDGYGGAIRALHYFGSATISDSRIVDNHVERPAAPVANFDYAGGGLVMSAFPLTIERTEIAQNSARLGGGLAVFNGTPDRQGAANAMHFLLLNSTVSGNSASGSAGAILAYGNVAVEIGNSTIAGNVAASAPAGIWVVTGATEPPSASNADAPTVTIVSSILSNTANGNVDCGVAAPEIAVPFFVNATSSLIQNKGSSCALVGAGNIVSTVPNLGPLVFNGGATRTLAPLPGSPVLNNGSNPLALTTDQRGATFARVFGAAADMGAYESTGPAVPSLGFLAPAKYATGASPYLRIATDLTGDGRADLASSNTAGNSVDVLLNDGSGAFTSQSYVVGSQPALAIACDVTGDGRPDIVAANKGSNTLSILVNQGNGTFVAAPPVTTGNQPVWVNCANSPNTSPTRHNLRVLNGGDGTFMHFQDDGFGNFTLKATVAVGSDPRRLVNVDLDLDGDGDQVAPNAGSGTVSVAKNNGSFVYAVTHYPVQGGPVSVTVSDLDGDGYPDITTVNSTANSVSVLINNGDASFKPAVHYPVGANPQPHWDADFNGDGRIDLAVRNSDSDDIAILINNGDGTFKPAVFYPVGGSPAAIVAADLDGDGIRDLVVAVATTNSIALLYGKGDGSFGLPLIIPVGVDPGPTPQIVDLDGDGRPDVAVALRGEGRIAVLLNTADGGAAIAGTFYAGPTPTGTGKSGIAVAGGGAACEFAQAKFVPTQGAAESPSVPPPPGFSFPQGLASFVLNGCSASASVTITVSYPNALPPGTLYWKYGPTPDNAAPHWYSIPATIAGNTMTFTIPDGGLGDDDLAVNGIIVDAGGPGVPAQPAPAMTGVASRKIHGSAGTFDLPLTGPPASPTVDPRAGPAHMLVFSFDKPVIGGTVAVTEGSAAVGVSNPSDVQKVGAQSIPIFEGGELKVGLSGVANGQYVTVTISNVYAADGGANGVASVRVGFLAGDVNASRGVSVADKFLVNNVLAQPVTAANFLRDVNVSGTLTLADVLLVNTNQALALP